MATLYRCTTPTDRLCPCGRVARALRSEGISVTEVRVPQRRALRPEVVALTDQQRVPVLVIDGDAICDSRRIVEHLAYRREHAGPGPAREPAPVSPPPERLWSDPPAHVPASDAAPAD